MLNEALTKEQNKALFRELVKKYHPDTGDNEEMTKKLLNARSSDEAFERFVGEVVGKKNPASSGGHSKTYDDSISEEMDDLLVELDHYLTIRFSGAKYKGVLVSCTIFDKAPDRVEIYVKTPNGKEARFYAYKRSKKEEIRDKVSKYIDENYLNGKAGYDSESDLSFNRRKIEIEKNFVSDEGGFTTTLETNENNKTMKIRVTKKDEYPRRFRYIDGVEKMSNEYITGKINQIKKELG